MEKAVILAKAVAKGEAKSEDKAKLVALQEGNVVTMNGLETLKKELEQEFEKKKDQERKSSKDKEERLLDEISTTENSAETLREKIEKAESGDKDKLETDLKAMELALVRASAKLEMVLDERKEAS